MKNSISIWGLLAFAAIIGFAMTACDDGLTGNKGSDTADELDVNPLDLIGGESLDESSLGNYSYTINYPDGEPYASRMLGWEWKIPYEGYDFRWAFYNDGTLPVIHCCGYTEKLEGYRYLFCGNVMVISYYGDLKVDYINMADNDVSFTWNGLTYNRGDPAKVTGDYAAFAPPPLRLKNELLGTWRGEDETEFEFSSDAGCRIGSDQYGYIAFNYELLTLGPIVDGGKAGFHKYRFNRIGNKLYLKRSDGEKYTLSLVE
jgi:hypothetical protein